MIGNSIIGSLSELGRGRDSADSPNGVCTLTASSSKEISFRDDVP
jgi:hypothetical protein